MREHHNVALTPPMGWNSWDSYGASVTEAEVRGNAMYMSRYLKPYGWEYVVVDIQWYEPGATSSEYRPYVPLEMDEYSRLVPAVNRFPSAAGGAGFRPLSDYVHGLGLKFGIHMMRGIPRQAVHANTPIKGSVSRARDVAHINSICPWNTDMYGVDATKEGAQAYYNSLFEMYTEWGVDFVKVDDIAASRLYGIHLDEIRLIRKAIDRSGRPMVLSLSPGPAPLDEAEFLMKNANMWRITDDFWDRWELLYQMFERCEKWFPYSGPGHWPDCDMLPLGRIGIRSVDGDRWTRFTRDEQITMMTLWTIFRSPLMVGGELRDNDRWTHYLLTNEEVLQVHKNSRNNRPLYRDGYWSSWIADDAKGNNYLALFNLSEVLLTFPITAEWLGLPDKLKVRNLWQRTELGSLHDNIMIPIPPHGAALLKIYPSAIE
ncbi:glycoside hydrolase family 27 protein [Paenibacillus sp. Soil522]|uniref:glycoside hydrolase family 27 protein n=1 Tax=Paenibacillus sp. Soil522 TaxID=1736388 RepID=UPI0006F53427|nr:glycoside hydrolase family 27 protein [Paenibacillus sp. Soil522]KRE46727.1 alpha-galactosidase [Paenibacillus sp. Soil522]